MLAEVSKIPDVHDFFSYFCQHSQGTSCWRMSKVDIQQKQSKVSAFICRFGQPRLPFAIIHSLGCKVCTCFQTLTIAFSKEEPGGQEYRLLVLMCGLVFCSTLRLRNLHLSKGDLSPRLGTLNHLSPSFFAVQIPQVVLGTRTMKCCPQFFESCGILGRTG